MKVRGIEDVLAALKNPVVDHKQLMRKVDAIANKLKEATPVDTGFAEHHWETERHGNTAKISNATPYISELNAGTSKQAPAHFVEKTVLSIPDVKPNGSIVTYKQIPLDDTI